MRRCSSSSLTKLNLTINTSCSRTELMSAKVKRYVRPVILLKQIPKNNPDSNFSLQQACHKFVKTRVQVCNKLTKASKSPWNELAASLPCKLIANYSKNRVRAQPGIELATYRLVARRRYHSASSTTRGEDRFR
ncbi:hypothetical protein AVEN_140718-1 [Araneus ventricosus]|uniref:Uncharacterized protein n=1 Tax=Araneus ventricosus TaxID=182803 RepID=A0A4Y2WW75_ARAVE|nr:hypothetical protein AVEN_140718-1 [Araneus ventricosus]